MRTRTRMRMRMRYISENLTSTDHGLNFFWPTILGSQKCYTIIFWTHYFAKRFLVQQFFGQQLFELQFFLAKLLFFAQQFSLYQFFNQLFVELKYFLEQMIFYNYIILDQYFVLTKNILDQITCVWIRFGSSYFFI